MKRAASRVIALLAIVLALPHAVRAADDAGLKSALEGRYAALKAAMDSRDADALRGLLAPEFTAVEIDGTTQSADQMLRELAGLPQEPNKKSETTLVSVRRSGDVATVEQSYHVTTTRTAPDGSPPRNLDLRTRSTDTWHLVGGAWLLERSATEEMEMKINGKAVGHKTRQQAH